jgi:hypothetical protein
MTDNLTPQGRRELMEAHKGKAEELYNLICEFVDHDDYPTREEADAILRAAGRDPADVGKIGELTARVAMLGVELAETAARAERAEAALREVEAIANDLETSRSAAVSVILYRIRDRIALTLYEKGGEG